VTEPANEGNRPDSVVPGIETVVDPHTVYVAEDPVRPRWRFAFVVQSRSDTDLEVVEFRIQHRAEQSGPWLQAQTPSVSPTDEARLVGRDITVGPSRVGPGAFTGIDLRDCVPGELPSAIRVEADLRGSPSTGVTTASRVVSLIPQTTRYVTFPLEGKWVAANARADLHGIGRAFAFDFVTEADWQIHTAPKGKELQPDQFDSYGRPLHSPVDGKVVACENAMPDLACTPRGGATYGKGLPDGLPKAALLGNYILIETDAADFLLLVHLKQGSVLVRPGMQVAVGQLVGRVGNSGNTSGAHLHIEMLDGLPDFEKFLTPEFRQSGLPFGFRDVRVWDSNGCSRGDLVPEKRDVVGRPSADEPV
jgi:hypothetical protein